MPARRGSDGKADRDPETTGGSGSKGIGVAIAGMLVTLFAALPFVTIVVLYTFVTIYAIVRAIGPGSGEDPVAIVVGFVLIGSALALLIAGAVYVVGRAITPPKRPKRDLIS